MSSKSAGRVYRRGDIWWLDYWVSTGEVDPKTGQVKTRRVRESSSCTRKSDASALLRKRAGQMEPGGGR